MVTRGRISGVAGGVRAKTMAAFTIAEDGPYIIGRFTEHLPEAAALAVLDELVALVTATKVTNILIDARGVTVPPDATAIYRLGVALAARLPPACKLAIVTSQQAGADAMFGAVAATQGVTVRYFTKLSAARAWMA